MEGEGLQILGFIERPSSGYEGEEVGSTISTPTAPGPEGQWNQFTADYYYRDSNFDPGRNEDSSRVDVTILNEYKYEKLSGNHYKIEVRGYLTKIERGHINGSMPAYPGRTIEVWGINGKSVYGPKDTSAVRAEVIYSGKAFLGENTYDLGPGEKTDINALSADYRSYTTNYWNGAIPSKYLDQMHMGLMFVNELPEECDPPVHIRTTQVDDICENYVDATLVFGPCSCEGMALLFEWKYRGQGWDRAQQIKIPASAYGNNRISLYQLFPTNHTWNPVVVEWRAKFVPDTSDMPETDYIEGNFQTLFILHPHETVPDISEEECLKIKRGELIGKYEQETCYNEFSCADMDVNIGRHDKDVEECKKINGVA